MQSDRPLARTGIDAIILVSIGERFDGLVRCIRVLTLALAKRRDKTAPDISQGQ